MDTDQIVAAILAAAQTAADGHNRADSYITNYRIMLAKLRDDEAQDDVVSRHCSLCGGRRTIRRFAVQRAAMASA